MASNKKNNKKVSLLSKSTIAALLVVAAGAIYLLTPTSNSLEDKILKGQSPEASLVYLNELEKVNPDDPMIPYLKAKIYYDKGKYNTVLELLAPSLKQDPKHQLADTYILYLKTKFALMGAFDNEPSDVTKRQLVAEIKAFGHKEFSDEQLIELSNLSLALNLTKLSFDFLDRVVDKTPEIEDKLYSIAIQGSMYEKATDIKYRDFLSDQTLEKGLALNSLYLQAFDKDFYKDFLSKYKGKLKDNSVFIKDEIKTANSLGLYDESLSLFETLCKVEPNEENFNKYVDLLISQSQLDKASVILESLCKDSTKYDSIKKLHDVYVWQGSLEKAQQTSLLLLKETDKREDLKAGLEESRSLADLYSMAEFYNAMYEKDLLESDDINDFIDTNEKCNGTEYTLYIVNKLYDKSPKDLNLLRHIFRLNSYLNKYEESCSAFETLAKGGSVSADDALRVASAYMMLGDDKSALRVLTSVKDWQKLDDMYVDKVSTLAWNTSNKDVAKVAENILFDRSSPEVKPYFLVNFIRPVTKENVDKLIRLYKESKDNTVLSEILSFAFNSSDDEVVNKVLKAIKDDPVYNSNEVVSYRAYNEYMHGNYNEAKKLYTQLLKANPHSIVAIDGLCNIALIENNQKEADRLYKENRSYFENDRNAWALAASLADTLNYKNEAKFFYEKIILNNDKVELPTLLSYAQLLEDLGQLDKAYRIRNYIVKNKTQELLALSDNNITLASLIYTFVDHNKSREVIKRELSKGDITPSLAQNLIDDALSQDNIKRALYLAHCTKISNLKIADYQALLLAVRSKDEAKIEELLKKGVGLTASNRYEALAKLGRSYEAYTLGQANIGRTKSKAEDNALRNLTANDNPKYNRSVQFIYTNVTSWGMHGYELSYHGPYSLGDYKISVSHKSSDAPDQLLRKRIKSEKRLQAEISLDKKQYEANASVDLADGAGKSRAGFALDCIYHFDERYLVALKGAVNAHSDLSHMMNVLGKDNYLEARINMVPYGRESFEFTTRVHNYKSRFNESLATGFDLEGVITSPVFLNDPYLNVYVAAAYQKNSLKDGYLTKSNEYNHTLDDDTNTITQGSYLGDVYKHVSLGFNLGHGTVQLPGTSTPGFRYLFDVATGYNLGEKKIDASLSAGAGISIFSSTDELSFRTSIQTVDRQGNRAFNLSLGYSLDF